MKVVGISNKKFGRKELYRMVSGFAIQTENGGYLAFSNARDEYNILIPYMPVGGKKALQAILDGGGFDSFDGMEIVKSLD